MLKFVLSFALVTGGGSTVMAAADLGSQNWLASNNAPACSSKPGVRSSRSDLVQYANISASISAQSSREENGSCDQSAAVWVTKGEVSQEFDLPDAATNTFSIIDFAPDSSVILLYKEKTYAVPGEDTAAQISLLALNGRTPQWIPIQQAIGWKNCAGQVEPEGFEGPRRIVFRATPLISGLAGMPACVDKPKLLALDLDSKTASDLQAPAPVKHNGHRLSGPLLACQSDPDVVGACYSMRGRVGLGANGVSMRLWQTETAKFMNLAEGMLPDELNSQVKPGTRVYADMIVCPLKSLPKALPTVCIESAGNYQRERVPPKQVLTNASAKAGTITQGASH